jgi:hypothetical protein
MTRASPSSTSRLTPDADAFVSSTVRTSAPNGSPGSTKYDTCARSPAPGADAVSSSSFAPTARSLGVAAANGSQNPDASRLAHLTNVRNPVSGVD